MSNQFKDLPTEKVKDIGELILERGTEELSNKVTDLAVIRIDTIIDNTPKVVWLYNKDSEGQKGLVWLPCIKGNVSTPKHRAFGSFLLQSRFDGGVFKGQRVTVNNISYYRHEAPGGVFDAVLGNIELQVDKEVKFKSLRKLLKELSIGNKELLQRELLDKKLTTEIDAILQRMSENDQKLIDKVEASQRYIREVNALIITLALDKVQSKVKDARVWDGVLIIDGGPGTGKTTTLIQRVNFLTQKHALHDYKSSIPAKILEELDGEKGWLFISPSELLKSYLQNAMAEEGLNAGNRKMKIWVTYLDELYKMYGLFEVGTKSKSPFTKARNLHDSLFKNSWELIFGFMNEFDQYIVRSIKKQAQKPLTTLGDKSLNLLRQEMESSLIRIEQSRTWIELFQFFSSYKNDFYERLMDVNQELKELLKTDAVRATANLKINNNQLYQDFGTWAYKEALQETDNNDTVDEEDDEDDEDDSVTEPSSQNIEDAVLRKVQSLMKASAMMAQGKGYSIKQSQKEWIERLQEYLVHSNFDKIGQLALLMRRFRRWVAGVDRRLLKNVPSYYKEFRKSIIKGELNLDASILNGLKKSLAAGGDKIQFDEMNFIFAWLNRKIKNIANRFPNHFETSAQSYIQGYKNCFRYNIVVDEATDFSLIELVGIDSLTHPQYKSLTICGDLMQRMSDSGITDWQPLLDSVENNGEVHELLISYRQTPTLLNIAKKFYERVTGKKAKYRAKAKPSANEPQPWVVQFQHLEDICSWVTERIIEIHTAYEGKTPSIAIFCINDDAVRMVTRLLKDNDDLYNVGINVQGIESTVAMVDASKVCVYNIQNIKGLEFEAVFFLDIDQFDSISDELLQKYLYVGLSRAAFYLGITYRDELPIGLKGLFE